jgi:exonuclease VII large subunit
VLQRGYVIVQRTGAENSLVTTRAALKTGDPLVLRFFDGEIGVTVQ